MEQPIKILSLVSYKFLPAKMGGQKGIALFNRYLSKLVPLVCVSVQTNSDTQKEPYPIHKMLGGSKLRYVNPFYFFKLRRFIKANSITHLILEHPYYGWLGLLLKWSCRIKLAVHSHNIESLRFKSMGKWWWGILWNYEKWICRNAGLVFFIQDDDKEYAIRKFGLDAGKCATITYGIETGSPPPAIEKEAARKTIALQYGISEEEKILLFNGTLDYQPNLDALEHILEKINPALLATQGFQYKIIICGKSLPGKYGELKSYADSNIIYAGFVDDIVLYYKAADIFINPVNDGGGIKTKLVEALAYDLNVVSTASGAIGIPAGVTGKKMKIVADDDMAAFAKAITATKQTTPIPPAFFDYFYWANICKKAADLLQSLK